MPILNLGREMILFFLLSAILIFSKIKLGLSKLLFESTDSICIEYSDRNALSINLIVNAGLKTTRL